MKDQRWPQARLIPTMTASGTEALERRTASVLLAVMATVTEFGKALLRPLGAPGGNIETFVETPFEVENGRTIRPDGLILVSRGSKSWTALVETKVGLNTLEIPQIEAYLELAKRQGYDAVLSISNQFVTPSSPYPIDIDRRKVRRVNLRHLSWIDVLTEARVQKDHKGIKDSDQEYILDELIRYLSDPKSGVVTFNSMGKSWTKVKEGVRSRTLRKNDEDVAAVCARWDDLVRFISLELTQRLGLEVKETLAKTERTPLLRQSALRDKLIDAGQLDAKLNVPNAAGQLQIVADLRSRQITVGTQLEAPQDKRSKGRVSWLLRQLQDAPGDLRIESKAVRSSTTSAAVLSAVRESPDKLFPEGGRDIRQFRISVTRNLGLKRDVGTDSFITSVLETTESFYVDVLQNLRAWKAPPPQYRRSPAPESEERTGELPQEVAKPVEAAESEMTDEAKNVSHVPDVAP